MNSIPYFRYRNLVSPVRGGSLGDPLKLPKMSVESKFRIENLLEKFLEPNVRLKITSLVGPQLTITMLVTLNRGGGVAIVSPDSTQTSLTIYTQKATVAWLAVAEWSGLPFWLRLVESQYRVPFRRRSHNTAGCVRPCRTSCT